MKEKVEISLERYDKFKRIQENNKLIMESGNSDFILVEYDWAARVKILTRTEYEFSKMEELELLKRENKGLYDAINNYTYTMNKIPNWIKRIFAA